MSVNRCIACGALIPEGHMLCWVHEHEGTLHGGELTREREENAPKNAAPSYPYEDDYDRHPGLLSED